MAKYVCTVCGYVYEGDAAPEICPVCKANPDGLEWSMEKVAGTTELDAKGAAYQKAADIQEWTALLPDYAFKNSESMAGTSFSGVAGAAVVVAVCVGGCYLFKFFGKNQKHE